MCLYAELGVSKQADGSEISKAFRKKALKFHPDKNKASNAQEVFRRYSAIHEILSKPASRDLYDQGAYDETSLELKASNAASDKCHDGKGKLTKQDIESYEKNYKFSEDEWRDLEDAIRKVGSLKKWKKIIKYVPFTTEDDIPRLKEWYQSRKKNETNKSKQNQERPKDMFKERPNDTKLTQYTTKGDLVSSVREKNAKQHASLIAKLESKYILNNLKRKKQYEKKIDEPPEEHFLRNRSL
jgi:curved DNA-binding protein CbpA